MFVFLSLYCPWFATGTDKMAHIYVVGSSIGFENNGFLSLEQCLLSRVCAMTFRCMERLPLAFTRQSRGVESHGLKILLCIFFGFISKTIMYFFMVFLQFCEVWRFVSLCASTQACFDTLRD